MNLDMERYRGAGIRPSGDITTDASGNPSVGNGTIAMVLIAGILTWVVIIGGIYYVVKK